MKRSTLTAGIALSACAAAVLGLAASAYVTPARAQSAGIFDATTLTTTDGRTIYEHVCRGCHMPEGAGAIGAGYYPALAKNPTLKSREYMAITILMGRRNMPAFGAKHALGFSGTPTVLSDEQVAAVVNYVRSNFGNHYKDAITADQVAKLDAGLR